MTEALDYVTGFYKDGIADANADVSAGADIADWQFVDKDEAIDGVNSGAYYAALIIPKSFSADMIHLSFSYRQRCVPAATLNADGSAPSGPGPGRRHLVVIAKYTLSNM